MLATAKYVVTRATGEIAQNAPKRARVAPPAAHLTDIDLPKRAALERIPETAAMTLVVYKVSDCAGDTMPRYRGASQAQLFEVMMEHHACPSLLHNLKNEFDEFLKHAHHTCLHGDEVPTSLEDMDTAAGMFFCLGRGAVLGTVLFPPPNKGITLVQTPINAPDHDGYALLSTRWQQIVGSESSVVNFVSLWDDFVLWKINKRGTTGLTEICIHVHFSIGLYETSFTRELADPINPRRIHEMAPAVF